MGRVEIPLFGSVILLAGGKSRRMGFDKQRLTIGDELVPHRQIRQLSAIFDQIIVSTKTPELYQNLAVQTVADLYPDAGPLAGIHAGLLQARSEYVYVIACDMPEIDASYIDFLKHKLNENFDDPPLGIATVLNDNIEPFQAFYNKRLARKIEDALKTGDYSVTQFIRNQPFLLLDEGQLAEAVPDLNIFQNLNKPEDIARMSESMTINSQVAEENDDKKVVINVDVLRVTSEESFVYSDTLIDEIQLVLVVSFEKSVSKLNESRDKNVLSVQTQDVITDGTGALKEKVHQYFHLLADRIDDFVTGWLRTNQLIESKDDILQSSHCQMGEQNDWIVEVSVVDKRGLMYLDQPIDSLRPSLTAIANSLPFSPDWLFASFDQLDQAGQLYHLTGGTHVLALYDHNLECLDVVEDVSRHVAFDKLIGKAMRDSRMLSDCFMLTSCRLTSSIVEKAAAVGITLLASRAAVTTRALEVAQQYNIHLIGFVRGGRMNVYP